MTWILPPRSHGMCYCTVAEMASNIKDFFFFTLMYHYYCGPSEPDLLLSLSIHPLVTPALCLSPPSLAHSTLNVVFFPQFFFTSHSVL